MNAAEIAGSLTKAQREAVAGAFVTANSGGGKYEISMKVHDMATLHTLHDAILKVGRICAGE